MSLKEIASANCIQPNRMFMLRGEVIVMEREVKYTKIILSVFNYNEDQQVKDNFTVWFKNQIKKVVDNAVLPKSHLSVIGNIVMNKEKKIFYEGKIIEVFKSCEFFNATNPRFVDPSEANYDPAF